MSDSKVSEETGRRTPHSTYSAATRSSTGGTMRRRGAEIKVDSEALLVRAPVRQCSPKVES